MFRHCTPAAFCAVLMLALAACTPSATRPSFPDLRFTAAPPLRIDASGIEVRDEFRPSFHEPEVDHLFPVPPERAVENWIHDRLQATGTTRRIVVHILDASVRETELPKKEGLEATLTTQQAEQYDGRIALRVELLDEKGFAMRTVSAEVNRTRSVPEGITPNERDQVWYDMTKQMLADLDGRLESDIRANFTFYVQ
jgi:hypothetical protein